MRRGLLVLLGITALFTWLFADSIVHRRYLTESDLYEYFLPIFLAPITKWSSFEFSGLPAFADPGDFVWYPPHFLFARIVGSWTAMVISAFVMAAAFTYAYVYHVTKSCTAAVFAAVAYGMSEALVERLPHLGTLHAFAWLPLILLAIEHLDDERPRTWMVIGGIGVASTFLAGHPQPAVYTVYVTGLYALVKLFAERPRLRFVAAVAGMYFIGGLLSSIKAIPLVEASTLMTRQEVNVAQFAGHANSPTQMLSVLFPTILHEGREAPTYVGLATLVFALAGASLLTRTWRVAFWTMAGVLALIIGAGSSTPVPALLYAVVPLYQKFRVGARHLFLFAFAAAFLAGWAIAALQRAEITARRVQTSALVLLVLIAAGAGVQAAAPGAFMYEVRRDLPVSLPIWNSGVWVQLAFATLTVAVAWYAAQGRRTTTIVAAAIALLLADDLYSLPYPVSFTGLVPISIAADDVLPDVHALRIGKEIEPLHQRLLAIGGTQRDDVVPAVFARLWRIPIAGGYGPMLMQRYSDLALMGTNGSVRPALVSADDRALDMMAVRYILVQPADVPEPATFERDGVRWSANEVGMPVGRPDCGYDYPRDTSLALPDNVDVAAVAIVTHLRCSEHVPQDTEVMKVRVTGAQGNSYEQSIRAGQETAETGLSDPGVLKRASHRVPPRFDDPEAGDAFHFATRIPLAQPVRGGRIDFQVPGMHGWITLDRLTLIDTSGASHPQSAPSMWLRDASRWREVRHFSTSRVTDRGTDSDVPGETPYVLMENLRALPRAWVVRETRGVQDADAREAVHRSQLPGGVVFDPRIMALVDPAEGADAGPFDTGEATASVDQIDDGRVRVSVSTGGGGFLVLSEQDYPGWRARIDDGAPQPVRRANIALMGIMVPPGRHTVQFELVSTSQRIGITLTVLGLFACTMLVVLDRTRRELPAPNAS